MKKKIYDLIVEARTFGLRAEDFQAIEELVANGEFKIGMEWLIDQLYEFETTVSQHFCEQALVISIELNVDRARIDLLKAIPRK